MDANLILRSGAANLTADETLTSVQVGPMVRLMWLNVLVPSIAETNDKIDVQLEFCDAAASTTEVYNMNMKQISAAGHYQIPFFTLEEYLQVKLDVTDADSGTDFNAGKVKVWLANAGRYDK